MAAETVDRSRRPALGFAGKVVGILIALVVIAQLGTLVVVRAVSERTVHEQLDRQLDVAAHVWNELRLTHADQLLASAFVLAGDAALRDAVVGGNDATLEAASFDHIARADIDAIALLAADGTPVAGALWPDSAAQTARLAPLLERARATGSAFDVVAFDGAGLQVALVPVRGSSPAAWVAVGQEFDADAALRYRSLTGLDVTFLTAGTALQGGGVLIATTLPDARAAALAGTVAHTLAAQPLAPPTDAAVSPAPAAMLTLADADHAVRVLPAAPDGGDAVRVLLQASVDDAMAPYETLGRRILWLSAGVAAIALLLAIVVGRSVSRPIAELSRAARRIESGDYSRPLPQLRGDEFGSLTRAFNRMQQGIAERESRIVHQAVHDGLTGLPNRTLAMRELERAIAHDAEYGRCAVLVLDVDRFKEINDTLGHAFGDEVLIEVSRRLRDTVGNDGMVARLGGDEFLVLLHGVSGTRAWERARQVARALGEPLRLTRTPINLDVSVGMACCPDHGRDAETLLRRADIALYDAKERHDAVAAYVEGRDETHLRLLGLMADLRRAIERDQLSLAFQPKVETVTGRVRHAEALLRWRHAEHGMVPPDEFIPLAERSGFIHELSRFVVRGAIAACRQWQAKGLDLCVAVNLSAMDLLDHELPDFIDAALADAGLAPQRLILEITESTLMRDVAHAIRMLRRLKASGVRIAIDDFGTGHSSLSQLKQLPVDELKIDKSFVLALSEDTDDAVIVRSTIELGHSMGLSVIAEGVETDVALYLLRRFDCDLVQGYLFSRPLPGDAFVDWCRRVGMRERVA